MKMLSTVVRYSFELKMHSISAAVPSQIRRMLPSVKCKDSRQVIAFTKTRLAATKRLSVAREFKLAGVSDLKRSPFS
jgi:hypothetical protein